jgi:hypothetical protein
LQAELFSFDSLPDESRKAPQDLFFFILIGVPPLRYNLAGCDVLDLRSSLNPISSFQRRLESR